MVLREHDKEFDERFDVTLREHVQRAAGVGVKSCAGFDADTAAAYLERALTSAARLRYEEHLADCHFCRRHLIELSRLMSQPAGDASPVAVSTASDSLTECFRERWRNVRRALTFPAQHWGAAVGVGLAALLVIFAVGPLLTQRQERVRGVATSMPAPAESQPATAPGAERAADRPELQSSERRTETVLKAAATPAAGRAAVSATPPARAVAAAPSRQDATINAAGVSGHVSDTNGAAIANAQVKLIDPASQQARATTTNAAGEFNFTNVPPGRYVVEAQAPGFAKEQNVADAQSANEIVTFKLRPGVATESAPAAGSLRTQPLADKSSELVVVTQPDAAARMRRESERRESDRLRALEGASRPEEMLENKAAAAKGDSKKSAPRTQEEVSRDEMAKKAEQIELMKPSAQTRTAANRALRIGRRSKPASTAPATRRVGEKRFHFENGVWVDNQYRPAENLPVTRLTHGSAEFDEVLAKTPELKPYFELKPVIVVWQGTVYQVDVKK